MQRAYAIVSRVSTQNIGTATPGSRVLDTVIRMGLRRKEVDLISAETCICLYLTVLYRAEVRCADRPRIRNF